jgi:hypothetical protein
MMSGAQTALDMTKHTSSIRSTRWWLRQDSQSMVIDAPAERIYKFVADLPRMGDWSPECRQVEWLDGSEDRPKAPPSSATTKAVLAA